MKRGFTVLELIVVIGIIGILMAVMLSSTGGASDSARASKCLGQLHNLASAVQTVDTVAAGSYETKSYTGTRASFREGKGWVSWASINAYRGKSTSHEASSGWIVSTYVEDVQKRTHCLTNGAIWRAISENASTYVCPLHAKYAKKNGVNPVWSYVMNSAFGWDTSKGSYPLASDPVWSISNVTRPDRRLLFAELPFNTDNTSQKCSFSSGAGTDLDPTLQYAKDGTSYKEYVGFNHKSGKKWYAHVCFADGHVEKLELPKGVGEIQMRTLTKLLCEGKDVSYNGSKYEELQ